MTATILCAKPDDIVLDGDCGLVRWRTIGRTITGLQTGAEWTENDVNTAQPRASKHAVSNSVLRVTRRREDRNANAGTNDRCCYKARQSPTGVRRRRQGEATVKWHSEAAGMKTTPVALLYTSQREVTVAHREHAKRAQVRLPVLEEHE